MRNSARLAAVAAIVVTAWSTVSAHRRDEYLQAARIGIATDRVEIELDLTPGIALATLIGREIDLDGTGEISIGEGTAYAAVVLKSLRLDVDGTPLDLRLIASRFPTIAAMSAGEGTIRLRIAASTPPLAAGPHELVYRNGHRPDIGVYLANALVPGDDQVVVTAQARDVAQRELTIAYVLRTSAAGSASRWPLSLPIVIAACAALAVATFWTAARKRRGS